MTTKPVQPNTISMKFIDITGKVSIDQTGYFPVTPCKGKKYLVVVYDYDTNAILTKPLQNREAKTIVTAQVKPHKYFIDQGFKPQLQILDNEYSKSLKQHFMKNNIKLQLILPYLQSQNAAERAISTFRNHLLAGLASFNQDFPMHL